MRKKGLHDRPWSVVLLLSALSGAVHAGSTDTTSVASTDKGCKFYTYPSYRITAAQWSLPCTAGSFVSGKGKLTFDSQLIDVASGEIKGLRHSEFSGQFKDGYLEGPGQLERLLKDSNGVATNRITTSGNFVRSERSGRAKLVIEVADGKGGWREEQIQDGEFQFDEMNGQATWTYYPGPGAGYRARIVSGSFDAARAVNVTVMYTDTWLGGTVSLTEPISFNVDGTIIGSDTVLHGMLARAKSRRQLEIPARALDNSTEFLRSFQLSAANWQLQCQGISDIYSGNAFICPGVMAISDPEFQAEHEWAIVLAELDNDVAPLNATDLQALRNLVAENEVRLHAQEQAEQDAEASATFTRDEFLSCIRFSERLEKQSQELEADSEAIDDDETALNWLISLHNAAVSVGGDGSGADNLNARQRQHNNWVERHNRQADAHSENVERYNDQCLIENASMPHAIVSELCAGSDSDFCQAWN